MDAIARNLEAAYPEADKGVGIVLIPLKETIVGDTRPILLLLLGAVGFRSQRNGSSNLRWGGDSSDSHWTAWVLHACATSDACRSHRGPPLRIGIN